MSEFSTITIKSLQLKQAAEISGMFFTIGLIPHFLHSTTDSDTYLIKCSSLGFVIQEGNVSRNTIKTVKEIEIPIATSPDLPLEVLVYNERTKELVTNVIQLTYDYLVFCNKCIDVPIPQICCILRIIYDNHPPTSNCCVSVCIVHY